MPATLRMAMLRARQKAAGYDFVGDAAGTLRARAGGAGAAAAVAATERGVRLSRAGEGLSLGVETAGVGRGGDAGSQGVLRRRAEGQELVLEREDGVEERYLAGPLGLEQTYVVRRRPEGRGPLTIEVAFDGLTPEAEGEAPDRVLLRDDAGRVRAGYRDLVAADAEGRDLPARMEVRAGGVALVIDEQGARYPLRIDPMMWVQQAELSVGGAKSVAVSGDTAVVGSFGVAYVFVQNGTTWTQQAELTSTDATGGDGFGESVAVSGGIAVVGAYDRQVGANFAQGAAYVFVQNGTTWTQQAELVASDGEPVEHFGTSVSVSGGTVLVGAPQHGDVEQGAAYVFVQDGTAWPQQAELVASDGAAGEDFGISVSLSGGIALVGAPAHHGPQGAAYVFVQDGTTWPQQAELVASDGGGFFGSSVSVSGGTAVIGAPGHEVGASPEQGAAYVFAQMGSTWLEQTELLASDGKAVDEFGGAVSLSGGAVLVGASQHAVGANLGQGAAYVFVHSGNRGCPAGC